MDTKTMDALASELEAACPHTAGPQASAAFGGILALIGALRAALASHDKAAIALAFKALLDALLGNAGSGAVLPASAMGPAAAGRINWTDLISILGKLLPLILGGTAAA